LAAAAGVAFKALREAGEFERGLIKFEVLTGSAEKARQVMEELAQFTATTPFQMEGVSKAASILLAFGAATTENLIPTLRKLGDISAVTGKDLGELAVIYAQIAGEGRLLTQDFKQLAAAGVLSINDLAKALGVSASEARKMMQEGKISFEKFQEVLFGLASEGGRFFQGTLKLSQSLQGRISTMMDNISMVFRELGNVFMDTAKTMVTAVSNAMLKLAESIKAVRERLLQLNEQSNGFLGTLVKVTAAVTAATFAWQSFGKALLRLALQQVVALMRNLLSITGLLKVALTGLVVGALAGFIHGLRTSKVMQQALVENSEKLAEAWIRMKRALLNVAVAIAKFLAKLIGLEGINWEEMRQSAEKFGAKMIEVFATVALIVAQFMEAATGSFEGLISVFNLVGKAIFATITMGIAKAIEYITGQKFIEALYDLFTLHPAGALFDLIMFGPSANMQIFFAEVTLGVITWFKDLLTQLQSMAPGFMKDLFEFPKIGADQVIQDLSKKLNELRKNAKKIDEERRKAQQEWLHGVAGGIQAEIDKFNLSEHLREDIDEVKRKFGELKGELKPIDPEKLKETAKEIRRLFGVDKEEKGPLSTMFDRIKQAVSGAMQSIGQGLRNAGEKVMGEMARRIAEARVKARLGDQTFVMGGQYLRAGTYSSADLGRQIQQAILQPRDVQQEILNEEKQVNKQLRQIGKGISDLAKKGLAFFGLGR